MPQESARHDLFTRLSSFLAICRQTNLSSEEFKEFIAKLEYLVKRLGKEEEPWETALLRFPSVSPQLLLELTASFQGRWEAAIKQAAGASQDLQEARNTLGVMVALAKELRTRIFALQQPPHSFVPFMDLEKKTIEGEEAYWVIFKKGGSLGSAFLDRDNLDLLKKAQGAKKGQIVRLNQFGAVVEILEEFEEEGGTCRVVEKMTDGRIRVTNGSGTEVIVALGGKAQTQPLASGDEVLLSPNNLVIEKIASVTEARKLFLQEDPQVHWSDIGGLKEQIENLRKKLERHHLYPEAVQRYQIKPLKGVLLHGPPGTGKTMLAKAAVHETAKFISQTTGRPIKGSFILVGGPAAIMNPFVGITVNKLKDIFSEAKKEAKSGNLVYIILDEFEGLFSMRQGGGFQDGGSRVREELVTQFNYEMDGVEELKGVVVFGLTNRPDILDPAVIRPGRFDFKCYIPRPNKEGAREIFSKYLPAVVLGDTDKVLPIHYQYLDPDHYENETYFPRNAQGERRKLDNGQWESYPLNHDPQKIIQYFIDTTVEHCYNRQRNENRIAQVIYTDGTSEYFTLDYFMSGAVIAGTANKAKELACDRYIEAPTKDKPKEGLRLSDFYRAVKEVMKEEQRLPTTREAMQQWLFTEGRPAKEIRTVIPLLGGESVGFDKTPTSQKMV